MAQWWLAQWWLMALGVTAFSVAAEAQPVVRVRAESRIELRIERRGNVEGVEIIGFLRDDLGTGLGGRAVRMTLEHEGGRSRHDLSTAPGGSFRLELPLGPGHYRLRASFAGDDGHEGLTVERPLDLDREEVRLFVRLEDTTLDLDRPAHPITVEARAAGGGDGLAVSLRNELDVLLARGNTDEDGQLVFALPSFKLGAPGPGRLSATTAGDERRGHAQTEVPIVRVRGTTISLEPPPTHIEIGDRFQLRGRLSNSAGPLRRRAIGIYATPDAADEEHRGTVLTDDEGHFAMPFQASHRDRPSLRIRARFDSDGPGAPSAVSDVVSVRIDTAPRNAWTWSLLPLALCAALIFALRRRPTPEPNRQSLPRPQAGISLGAPRKRSATFHEIEGCLLDQRTDRPLTSGTVVARSGDAVHRVRCDQTGRFSMTVQQPGPLVIRFEAEGFAAEEQKLALPHRGEWCGITIRLESWRTRAIAPLRRLAHEELPSRIKWSSITLHQLGKRRDVPQVVRSISTNVERLYYGPVSPKQADVDALEDRVQFVEASKRPPRDPGPRTR